MDVNIPNTAWIPTKSLEIIIMTNDYNTIFRHPHIRFQHLRTNPDCILESGQGVFWSFPRAASMRSD